MTKTNIIRRLALRTSCLAAALSLVSLAVASSTLAGGAATTYLGALAPGDAVVAVGPTVDEAAVFWEACNVTGPCFEYAFDISAGAARLRVMLDSNDNADMWGIRVRTPSGRTIDQLRVDPTEIEHSTLMTNSWTTEIVPVEAPQAGRWELLVDPLRVSDGAFRVRVQLDATTPAAPGPKRPNLRAVPPFALGFVAPAQQVRPPTGNHVAPPPLEAGGQRPASCLVDEIVNEGARRCLRFGVGLANSGDGPLDVRFDRTQLSGAMTQHVRDDPTAYTNGPRYEIHASHMHFHNLDMARTDVFRVAQTGAKPHRLEAAGSSTKHGFCLDDSLIFDISSSSSDRQFEEPGNCDIVAADSNGRMVLTRGWTDVYPWYLPGMYVEFSGLGNGDYVLRTTVDPAARIVETNEGDNVAYTWISVRDDTVKVKERGYGTDPWDRHARIIVATGWPTG